MNEAEYQQILSLQVELKKRQEQLDDLVHAAAVSLVNRYREVSAMTHRWDFTPREDYDLHSFNEAYVTFRFDLCHDEYDEIDVPVKYLFDPSLLELEYQALLQKRAERLQAQAADERLKKLELFEHLKAELEGPSV